MNDNLTLTNMVKTKLACLVVLALITLVAGNSDGANILIMNQPGRSFDDELKAHLELRGHTVDLYDTGGENAREQVTKAEAYDLVYITESLLSDTLTDGAEAYIKNVATPMIVAESWCYDDLAMTGDVLVSDYGVTRFMTGPGAVRNGQDSLVIIDPAHPLAAGFDGTVTVYNKIYSLIYGSIESMGPGVNVVAAVDRVPELAVLFVYEKGAELADGTSAAEMRIGFFFGNDGTSVPTIGPDTPRWSYLHENSIKMLDAAIDYALGPLPEMPSTQALSQTILIDDFNDGNFDGWTTLDASHGQGTFEVTRTGAFHLEGPRHLNARWNRASDPIFTDGYVRAKIRVEAKGNTPALVLRGSNCDDWDCENGYVFFANSYNEPYFFFREFNNGSSPRRYPVNQNLPFGVNEWWNIEAGAVGDQLSMKVWRVGDPEPESHQWTMRDATLTTGDFGILAGTHSDSSPGTLHTATFDDIYFRFPEHDDVYTVSPYNIYLWASPMPVPQVEGPFFVADSPEKPDMRGDVTKTEGWLDLLLTGNITDFQGRPIPGLKLDFWQTDDKGSYDNSGGYNLRGHVFTNTEGNYEMWTVTPAVYETIRTRHLHLKIGGQNMDFDSPVYTTQLYLPAPYDSDIDADGTRDKVVQDGIETEFDAITLEEDYITIADVQAVGAEFSDLAGNIVMLNNDPAVDGYFDTTIDIMMPEVFQSPEMAKRILIDNFNDGNDDGWIRGSLDGPIGPAIFDASSGANRLASTGAFWNVGDIRNWDEFRFTTVLDTLWDPVLRTSIGDPLFYSNGLFRYRFRIDGNATHLRLHMRANQVRPGAWSFYTFGATSLAGSQDPENDPVFVFRRQVVGVGRDELLHFGDPHLHEEWMLEAGAIGNRLTMKWWAVGAPEPAEPQWEWIDQNPLPPGIFYMEIFIDRPRIVATGTPPPWLIDTTVDDIYFIPGPSPRQ